MRREGLEQQEPGPNSPLRTSPGASRVCSENRVRPLIAPGAADVDFSGSARWIWYPREAPLGFDHGYFRGTFNLDEMPVTALVRVTAESLFEMWINGTWVSRGPVLSDPRWKAYDTINLDGLLVEGINTFALSVQYVPLSSQRGAGGTGAAGLQRDISAIERRDVPPAGLFVQAEFRYAEGRCEPWGTDRTWRGIQAGAWWLDAPRFDDVTYQEVFDARCEPAGWTQPDFDDSRWSPVVAVPDPSALNPPDGRAQRGGHHGFWRLEPHALPAPRRTPRHPAAVVEAGEVLASFGLWDPDLIAERLSVEAIRPSTKAQVRGAENLVGGRGPAVLSGSDAVEDWTSFDGLREPAIVLDFGVLMNARLEIEVEGESGAILEIGYAPHLKGDGVIPGFSRRNRQADRYVLRAGRQAWRTFNWRCFRYVKIVARRMTQPLTLHVVRAEAEDYGDPVCGSFECSDPRLARLWAPSVATTQLCTLDRYMDNPSRERKQWGGDIAPIALAALATYGPTPLHHRYFSFFFRLQTASGHLPKLAPWLPNLATETDLLDHAMWTLVRTAEYVHYAGDHLLSVNVAAAVERFVTHLERFEDADGLLDQPPFRIHMDWAPLDKRGTSFLLNALYVLTLESAFTLLAHAGHATLAETVRAKAGHLRDKSRPRFWDAARGVFADNEIDGKRGEACSEHALALALLAGIADTAQAETAIAVWREKQTPMAVVQPSFMLPLLEGLARHGQLTLALETLADRFGRFLDQGFETFGELWSVWGHQIGTGVGGTSASDGTVRARWFPRDSRAIAQGCSAWPGWFLHRHVLGVRPTAPGFATFDVAPGIGEGRTAAQGDVPIHGGSIRVRWAVIDGTLRVDVTHPHGLEPRMIEPTGWRITHDQARETAGSGTCEAGWELRLHGR